MSKSEFKKWITKSHIMENILIGYFLGRAIIEFYDALFIDMIKPFISYYLPGNLESTTQVPNGPSLKLNNFGSESFKFGLSILFAFYLNKYLKKYKNSKC